MHERFHRVGAQQALWGPSICAIPGLPHVLQASWICEIHHVSLHWSLQWRYSQGICGRKSCDSHLWGCILPDANSVQHHWNFVFVRWPPKFTEQGLQGSSCESTCDIYLFIVHMFCWAQNECSVLYSVWGLQPFKVFFCLSIADTVAPLVLSIQFAHVLIQMMLSKRRSTSRGVKLNHAVTTHCKECHSYLYFKL